MFGPYFAPTYFAPPYFPVGVVGVQPRVGSGDDWAFLAWYRQQELLAQQRPAVDPRQIVVAGTAYCVGAPGDVTANGRVQLHVERTLARLYTDPWLQAQRDNAEDERVLQALGVL